jgi:hypothetical protein
MYDYQGLQDVFFIMLYGMAGFFAMLACVYLLLRRGNAFAEDVRSSCVLRRWTAAFMAAIVASHVWWYVLGTCFLTDDRLVRNITTIMLDHVTLVPLTMAVLLAMLQDRRRPLWPWLLAQAPEVLAAALGIAGRSEFWGYQVVHYWQLGVIAVFVVYYIIALRQYERWVLDNYADLEHKEVWQSMVFIIVLLAVYMVYTSNAGELVREYLSQIITLVIIAFLLWRVETLQELDNEL